MSTLLSLCLVLALSLSTGLSLESQKAEDGYDVFPSVPGSRFKLYTDEISWENALYRCVNDGGGSHLIIINSEAEAEVVRSYLVPLMWTGWVFAWVGTNDISTEGRWVTIEGGLVSASGYNVWTAGQPNGGTAYNCGAVYADSHYSDLPCSAGLRFICEKPDV